MTDHPTFSQVASTVMGAVIDMAAIGVVGFMGWKALMKGKAWIER